MGTYDTLLTLQDGNQANNFVMASDNNGNAIWTNPNNFATRDDDWRFATSGTTVNDPIYRTGQTGVGFTGRYNALFGVEETTNSSADTEFGIGNIEYFRDRVFDHGSSHNVVPIKDNTVSCGLLTLRWDNMYSLNGTIHLIKEKKKLSYLYTMVLRLY